MRRLFRIILICSFIIFIIPGIIYSKTCSQNNPSLGLDTKLINALVFQQEDDDSEDIDIDVIDKHDEYPLWELLPEGYYENPFRRFEIIFFASFSYIFFLNVTLIETITQFTPADYGKNLVFDSFPLPLFYYTFISTLILSIAVAVEDYRYVYIEHRAYIENNTNNDLEDDNLDNNDDSEDSQNVEIKFAPKLYFDLYGKVAFRLIMINF